MTKAEFKQKWESDKDGGGITYEEVADCAIQWGLYVNPTMEYMTRVTYAVLCAARVKNAEDWNLRNEEQEAVNGN